MNTLQNIIDNTGIQETSVSKINTSDTVKTKLASAFSRASVHYNAHAQVQKKIALATSEMLKNSSNYTLDIGCGTGQITEQLSAKTAYLIGVDIALGMLNQAQGTYEQCAYINADAECLPFRSHCVDQIFSSMALQWCYSPKIVMQEFYRVLFQRGSACLAILVDGALAELNNAWGKLEQASRVNQFHSVDAWLKAAQLAGFVINSKVRDFVTYHDSVLSMLHSIKYIGANTANQQSEHAASIRFSKQELTRLSAEMEHSRERQGLPLTYKVLMLEIYKEPT